MRDSRRTRLILGILLAAALVLITVGHRSGDASVAGPLRQIASSVFGAAEQASTKVTEPVSTFFSMVTGAPGAKERIDGLKKENAQLRSRLAAAQLDRDRSKQLDRMLGLSGLGHYRVVPAQVIARRHTPGLEDNVEIDVGSRDGVRRDMTVLNGDGLVGRVIRTGPGTSTVILLTDPGSSAGARLEGGRELGVVSGLGENGKDGNLIRLRLLASTVPLKKGRRIVSFGSQNGTPYVPGVPIGEIERVQMTPGEVTRTAYARPYADFSALDVVGVVVRAPDRDPRDSVLPQEPGRGVPGKKDKGKDHGKDKSKDRSTGQAKRRDTTGDSGEPDQAATPHQDEGRD
ncbi:rod shape-determining protein MreC [Microtetraspora sp. NBRC 16547]|uniref:rod shape-determining protein MreC n=1 Tax=Microtetraspora sp. NBRC 16547 TaxID=3030993 RepID=UPI0024A049AE|nr:rod shape-determining protein MreC [Microtetraspora sp. NBRC 16547]GLX00704.1 rod shape-determining protein MreC [Microtetraspora sp. NBRC 16547]